MVGAGVTQATGGSDDVAIGVARDVAVGEELVIVQAEQLQASFERSPQRSLAR